MHVVKQLKDQEVNPIKLGLLWIAILFIELNE